MSAIVLQANGRSLPLPDDSVDLVVTSPPYFALRSYTDGGEHYSGQVGDESTPQAFIDSLLEVTRECVRVLKSSGSLWVNLGDKYAAKSLMGLPWRYALGCIDDVGLVLRAEVIWAKPSGVPESVTDRVQRSHEQWFHFTLEPHYFCEIDRVREPYSDRVLDRQRYAGRDSVPLSKDRGDRRDGNPARGILAFGHRGISSLGKLPGSVWTVPLVPLRIPKHLGVDHFAAFPPEFPRRIILGWSPPTGTVLDPFGGTGTTALVADCLGRTGISVDLSHDYSRLAQWRTNDPKQRAKVLGINAPPVEHPGQQSIFGESGAA